MCDVMACSARLALRHAPGSLPHCVFCATFYASLWNSMVPVEREEQISRELTHESTHEEQTSKLGR